MKKASIAILIVIVSIVTALGVSAEGNSVFSDVNVGAWYYEAVNETVDKGIFTGVTADRFEPDGNMTRAMFVTTLAKVAGANVGEYTATPFTDVEAGAWYAPYVQWAYENDITKGVATDLFGVDNAISREEMVTLFYNAAAKFGEDTEVTDTYKYDKVNDKEKIDSWADEAMKWAMQNSIIAGTDTVGTMVNVSPDATATRAQAAQIITRYLVFLEKDMPPVTGLTINGNPIDKYTIVYSENVPNLNRVKDPAYSLQEYIAKATGITLPVVTDNAEPTGYEILVGRTNREDKGIVTADRDGEDRCSFEISVQGNNVIIAGKYDQDYRTGTKFGVFAFAEEVLGYEFYSDHVVVNNVKRDFDLPDNYEFKDGPGFEYRVVYWDGLVSEELSTGEPFIGTGFVHNMSTMAGSAPNPCLTDPVNVEAIKKSFMDTLAQRPELETYWVSQDDTNECCECDNCLLVYREEGSRAGAVIRLCNMLAKEAEATHPDLEIWTLAYIYSTVPVRSQLDDSVVIYYCPITNCTSHTYNDPSCPLNISVYKHINGWSQVCDKIYVWDYSTNFKYSQTPLPINTVIHENRRWFYEMGVRGEFNNAISKRVGEFSAMKAYLLAETQWDPTMTDEEYNDKINSFLEVYYGPGWKYVRQYIDKTEELSDANCFGYSGAPSSVIKKDVVLQYIDEFDAWWDAAEALCDNEDQRQRIRISRMSWLFMKLDAVYESMYTNGDAASRAEYSAMATAFHDEAMVKYDLRIASSSTTVSFDDAKSPVDWVN